MHAQKCIGVLVCIYSQRSFAWRASRIFSRLFFFLLTEANAPFSTHSPPTLSYINIYPSTYITRINKTQDKMSNTHIYTSNKIKRHSKKLIKYFFKFHVERLMNIYKLPLSISWTITNSRYIFYFVFVLLYTYMCVFIFHWGFIVWVECKRIDRQFV